MQSGNHSHNDLRPRTLRPWFSPGLPSGLFYKEFFTFYTYKLALII